MGSPAEAATDVAFQYGVVGVVALVFAIATIYLFKRYEAREREHTAREKENTARWDAREKEIASEREAMIEEREGHQTALVAVRVEYEVKHRELVQQYAASARADHSDNRAHEDAARREFANIMTTVEDQAAKSAAAVTAVLEKLHDRFVGPRARSR